CRIGRTSLLKVTAVVFEFCAVLRPEAATTNRPNASPTTKSFRRCMQTSPKRLSIYSARVCQKQRPSSEIWIRASDQFQIQSVRIFDEYIARGLIPLHEFFVT